MAPTEHLWALVLAGGDGTRLQALTRLIAGAPIPKQYCRILGDRSLLETTLARIAPGRPLVGPGEAFRVVAFHEKPAPAQAARIMGRGGLWNSFVMVGRVARMLELVREVRPADVAALAAIPAEPDALGAAYERLASWNFSRDFLARVPEHLMVARVDDLGWSDWGTPEAIERTLAALRVVPPWRVPLAATA